MAELQIETELFALFKQLKIGMATRIVTGLKIITGSTEERFSHKLSLTICNNLIILVGVPHMDIVC